MAAAPGCALVCVPIVVELLLVVVAPWPALFPPIPEPAEPAVCAPAHANAPSKTGAANHVRFILKYPSSRYVVRAALLPLVKDLFRYFF